MAKNYQIRIDGAMVSVIRPESKNSPILTRRIVGPMFIRVLYSIRAGEFDQDSWNLLPTDEKMFMSRICSAANIDNRDLAISIATLTQDIHERLKLIEGAVLAGNLNKELVTEYIDLIDKLGDSGSLNKMAASKMKTAIRNTYQHLLS